MFISGRLWTQKGTVALGATFFLGNKASHGMGKLSPPRQTCSFPIDQTTTRTKERRKLHHLYKTEVQVVTNLTSYFEKLTNIL